MKVKKEKGKCPFRKKGTFCEVTYSAGYGDLHYSNSKDPEDSKEPITCHCWNKDPFSREEN